MSTTGERIRAYRKIARMTQEQLAEKVGVNRVTITQYENGSITPPLDRLEKVASALGCSLIDLIDSNSFHNASDSDKEKLTRLAGEKADEEIARASYISELAGYQWELLPEVKTIEEKTIYLTDKKTGSLYAVESDLFTDAINGSTEFIKFKFEKLMKTAKVVNNGRKTEEGQERTRQDQ